MNIHLSITAAAATKSSCFQLNWNLVQLLSSSPAYSAEGTNPTPFSLPLNTASPNNTFSSCFFFFVSVCVNKSTALNLSVIHPDYSFLQLLQDCCCTTIYHLFSIFSQLKSLNPSHLHSFFISFHLGPADLHDTASWSNRTRFTQLERYGWRCHDCCHCSPNWDAHWPLF